MARYTGPSCKLCRAAGVKLFLKGDRCYTSKCAIEKRNTKPGTNRAMRGKESEYAIQLKEKQKIKRMYGLLENQFYNYFKKADAKEGVTGELLLQMLERRLDNVVYRLGLAKSRSQARQFVGHGHVRVDGKRVDIPSYLVSVGEVLSFGGVKSSDSSSESKLPNWLAKSGDNFVVEAFPLREAIDADINEQMVVDFYSR